ncbi:kinesin-like protein KIFC3 isoform X5 [Chaetodon auriga]|uniref:kinesin-like protein KIFC3 isoform X5 n=1 Tax=Chaetodon auriga TaxID=39042 RepID=UPI004032E17C
MYVLCTLAVLTLHNLFKSWTNKAVESSRSSEAAEQEGRVQDGGAPEVWGAPRPRGCEDDLLKSVGPRGPRSCRAEGRRRRRGGVRNLPNNTKRVQPVQRSSALLSPAVMFSTRKTWDLSHTPCLQELWKNDISLDASSVDFLMSDGEDDGSFLSLPTAAFSQRPSLTAELTETSVPSQQLLIQRVTWSCWWSPVNTLQDKVCEFQARLRSEEVTRHLLLQQLQEKTSVGGGVQTSSPPNGVKVLLPGEQPTDRLSFPEEEQLITQLRRQVEELEEKLLDQTQEVERLRSELGATDLEKQLELLVVENQRLKQELKSCRSSELQSLDAAAETCSCSHCPHGQDVESLRREVSRWESQARQRERRLAELERELLDKTSRAESLHRQLDESTRQLDDGRRQLEESRRRQGETEQKLNLRLQECEEELARQAATPPRVKYVTHTVEVESAASQKALAELQTKNAGLQEQLSAQRQLLRELETQLHESQRTCAQLRTQILVYEGEMERAQGQLEAEMQNLEEEKNRVIEEAFIRAESEMKAVHENLAGVRMNLLSLQPALRTLTCDYNCLKRQVQDFPFMLDKAITEAKQEICQVISEVSSTNQELLRKYKREMNLRKKCHNELVRLKGNIRVFCRVRPVSQEEQDSADAKTMLSFDSEDDAILYLSNKGKIMTFELDKVFSPQATQEEVFQEVQALVTSCIDGFNVCIFAYGQTGSGKTYTMEGVADDPGINQRALRLLFSEVMEKAPDWDYKITVSMVEIYNETLRNLLGENPTDKLDIKMNPDGSGQLYVPGLTEFIVQSPEDINRVFELGHMNRATACTNLNEHSSRSHALLIITVSGFNTATGNRTQGKLNLVDLAGSERIAKSGAEGSRLREAQCINKSLSALGDVINALRSKHSHVPFRNSRLTYLLQDSLSGDSKTLMMVQVSPLPGNMSESVCSLKFAQRVRSVELSSSSSRRHENSSTSSSPTHDSVELDSPPVTPVPLPISRASSAGSTLSSASRTPSSSRRRSQSQLSTGRLKLTA